MSINKDWTKEDNIDSFGYNSFKRSKRKFLENFLDEIFMYLCCDSGKQPTKPGEAYLKYKQRRMTPMQQVVIHDITTKELGPYYSGLGRGYLDTMDADKKNVS